MQTPDVSFEINTGSRQTLVNLLASGGLSKLVTAGARTHEPGCLGCIGMVQAPASGTNSLRTFPRNFKGRSGTTDDAVYLCSPETAAASALAGYTTDPRTHKNYPTVALPGRFAFSPKWFQYPASAADADSVEIIRGPNIKEFPTLSELPQDMSVTVALKVGDNVSTDTIMPAGNRVLPFRSNIPAISRYVYDVIDPEFPDRCESLGTCAIVGGHNYGQGSSREHAALAPRYLGVRLKLARSFARIHKSNLVNFGIVPLVFNDPGDYDRVEQGSVIRIPGIRDLIEQGAEQIPITVDDVQITARLELSRRLRRILLAGGALNYAGRGV